MCIAPVLSQFHDFRFIIESIRPEIRQYLIESDSESAPFSRLQRSIVYQRAKGSAATLPFGTRRDVYQVCVCVCVFPDKVLPGFVEFSVRCDEAFFTRDSNH